MLHSRHTLNTLRESFGEKVFDTVIRKSVRYPESAERGLSILDYQPELGGDYIRIADELLVRLGEEDARERVGALRGELVPG
jgi:chromosome partitioning protein